MSTDRAVVVVVGTVVGADTDSLPHQCAALISNLVGVRAEVLALDPGAPHEVEAVLDALPADTGAIFLPDAPPEVACRARAQAGVPVLTGQDTIGIALAAAVSTTLVRAGRAPRAGQVVIAGADALPILCPLLMVGEVGTVTTWNLTDAHSFPLSRVAAGADVVIDLLGALNSTDGVGPVVIAPDRERDTLLALPGLVRALVQTPGARLDVDVHHACALALVMTTPHDERVPREPSRELTDRIAEAAAAALRSSAHDPFETNSG
jgi:hypothetical protein